MKNSILYVSGLALAMLAASCANNAETDSAKLAENANEAKIDSAKATDNTDSTTSTLAKMEPDAEFAVAAADGGMMEVALGKLAQQKGVSKEIKDLGAMMVKNHSEANDELVAAAKAKNIVLPGTMSDKCEKVVKDLTEKKGADFDKAYADFMVEDHKDDLDIFKKQAKNGNDTLLSSWARGKIPVLEHHLMMAEQVKKAVDKTK